MYGHFYAMKLKVGVMRGEDGFLKEVRNRESSGNLCNRSAEVGGN